MYFNKILISDNYRGVRGGQNQKLKEKKIESNLKLIFSGLLKAASEI